MKPNTTEAYKLFHEGALTLSDIEANGIRIDIQHCKRIKISLEKKIKVVESKIMEQPETKIWKRRFGRKFNIYSNHQLRVVLFDETNIKSVKKTNRGGKSTDNESLVDIGIPLTRMILKLRGLKKIKDTYLQALTREEINGYIHPFFGLIGVRTYRSQSDHPNFHNLPTRDPVLGKMVRQAIIPRPGNQLVERDYKGIEISVAQCYNQDPVFLYDIEHGDMHRDAAMKCFMLEEKQMTKDIRYLGKNKWVFPQFYGDWYVSCAEAQWKELNNSIYSLRNGITLKKHLQNKGIADLNDFKHHLEKVESWFWNTKYKIYTTWKKKMIEEYGKKGYIDTLTGFRCSGLMDNRQVINYPIQGSAFHCLLWSLNRAHRFLKKYNMKSKIIAQIHDSILTDECPSEQTYIEEEFERIMTVDLRKQFKWISAPMKIEVEKTEINKSWWTKK